MVRTPLHSYAKGRFRISPETASDLVLHLVAGAVSWFRTSEWGVSRHRNSVSQVIGNGRSRSGSAMPTCRSVAWSSPLCSPSPAQSEVARTYGVSQGWISQLMARYRAEGEAAFEPRSRRPKTSPDRDPAEATVELVLRLRKQLDRGGPGRRRRHDRLAPGPPPPDHACRGRRSTGSWSAPGWSPRTRRSDPKSSYIRFEAEQPNETWQSDFTHYRLTSPTAPGRHRDPHLARRPLPLRPVRHRPPPRHRPDRADHLPPSR